jgi:serpin B
MMHTASCFAYAETAELQLLEMPYVGHDISMLLLLPRSIDGLRKIESTITENDLEAWTRQMEPQDVIVTLPRFRIETTCELSDTLKSLGMVDAFDLDIADFSLVDGCRRSLCFSKVFHKAFIDVNEEGTEAAAATAGAMEKEEDDSEAPPQFRADHPFLLLLRERSSGIVLFLGRLGNPEESL